MAKFLFTLFDRVMSVGLVILFCQFPLFIQQYEMHLQGHLEESAVFISWFQKNAESSKKTLPVYIQKFLAQDDQDFKSAGKVMQRAIMRHQDLLYASTCLKDASALRKPFVFLKVSDSEIVSETLHSFHAGLSFSFESFIYALTGFLLWTVFSFLVFRNNKYLQINK